MQYYACQVFSLVSSHQQGKWKESRSRVFFNLWLVVRVSLKHLLFGLPWLTFWLFVHDSTSYVVCRNKVQIALYTRTWECTLGLVRARAESCACDYSMVLEQKFLYFPLFIHPSILSAVNSISSLFSSSPRTCPASSSSSPFEHFWIPASQPARER